MAHCGCLHAPSSTRIICAERPPLSAACSANECYHLDKILSLSASASKSPYMAVSRSVSHAISISVPSIAKLAHSYVRHLTTSVASNRKYDGRCSMLVFAVSVATVVLIFFCFCWKAGRIDRRREGRFFLWNCRARLSTHNARQKPQPDANSRTPSAAADGHAAPPSSPPPVFSPGS